MSCRSDIIPAFTFPRRQDVRWGWVFFLQNWCHSSRDQNVSTRHKVLDLLYSTYTALSFGHSGHLAWALLKVNQDVALQYWILQHCIVVRNQGMQSEKEKHSRWILLLKLEHKSISLSFDNWKCFLISQDMKKNLLVCKTNRTTGSDCNVIELDAVASPHPWEHLPLS